MTVGALIFWLFIGGPIVLTLAWWAFMLVCMPFFAAGAGARAVKENRQDKRLETIRQGDERMKTLHAAKRQRAIAAEVQRLDEEERAHLNQERRG
jgi:uncharacterized membrane protein